MENCLLRHRSGDPLAAAEMMGALRPMVLRIVRRNVYRRDLEEDIAQQIFAKVFARLHQYEAGKPIAHWVSRIAQRTCFDHTRAQRSRPELRFSDLSEEHVSWLMVSAKDERADRPRQISGAQELVVRLLAALTWRDRRLITAFHIHQKSITEIGREMGWPNDTVKMRLFRSREKIRRHFLQMPAFDQTGSRAA